jgi:phage terminase large subunit
MKINTEQQKGKEGLKLLIENTKPKKKTFKQITFNFKEFNPNKEGLYFYQSIYFSFNDFCEYLKSKEIAYYVNELLTEELLKEKHEQIKEEILKEVFE